MNKNSYFLLAGMILLTGCKRYVPQQVVPLRKANVERIITQDNVILMTQKWDNSQLKAFFAGKNPQDYGVKIVQVSITNLSSLPLYIEHVDTPFICPHALTESMRSSSALIPIIGGVITLPALGLCLSSLTTFSKGVATAALISPPLALAFANLIMPIFLTSGVVTAVSFAGCLSWVNTIHHNNYIRHLNLLNAPSLYDDPILAPYVPFNGILLLPTTVSSFSLILSRDNETITFANIAV